MSNMLQYIDTVNGIHFERKGFFWYRFDVVNARRVYHGISYWLTFKESFTQRIDKEKFMNDGTPFGWGVSYLIDYGQAALLHPVPFCWLVRWVHYYKKGKKHG